MTVLNWSPTAREDVPDLVRLGRACLERDGGLPDLADPEHLQAAFLTGTSICGRDELGEVVAAAAIGINGAGERTATGLVDPAFMSQGVGDELAAWVLEHAGGPLRFVMDSMSPEAESLFIHLGLRRVFAETVMQHSLRNVPVIRQPGDIVTLPFTDDTSEAFRHAYAASFADQPGYDPGRVRAWGRRLREQRGFHREDSRVALDIEGHVAGFVTISGDWIEEVGVVPQWRGRGLGAHLVVRSLTAIAKRGEAQAWLAVGCENPARVLYERLGFRNLGTRALYEEGTPPGAETGDLDGEDGTQPHRQPQPQEGT